MIFEWKISAKHFIFEDVEYGNKLIRGSHQELSAFVNSLFSDRHVDITPQINKMIFGDRKVVRIGSYDVQILRLSQIA